MITLFCVYSDYVYHRWAYCDNWYGVITSRYWILEKSSDFIEATIRYTHAPNKIFDLFYMLLVRFCHEYNLAHPWAFTLLNQIILQKITNMIHYDPWFMWSVPWHFTTNRWGFSSVDREFVPEDCTMRSLFAEIVPVNFDYTDESLSWISRLRVTNSEPFFQFTPIFCMIIYSNIIPGVCLPIDLSFEYQFTIMSIIK